MSAEFYEIFEKFFNTIASMREFDLEQLTFIHKDICTHLGISKITTDFYASPRDEAVGNGRQIVCYDSGESGSVAIKKRILTEAMSVVDCTIYKADSCPEWDDDTRAKAEMVNNVMAISVSRSAVLQVAKQRTFFDEDGYRNLNSFMKDLEIRDQEDRLRGFAAINFNLKHFALVNQQVGRQRGNIVMRGFIAGMEGIAGETGLVCRMGGDNFVALVPLSELDRAIEYLSGSAVAYNDFGDRVMIYATAGISVMDESFVYSSPSDVMDRIISALQAARNGGGDEIVFFNSEMEKRKKKIMHLQQLFPEALANGEFLIYYQPKVEIRSGRLVGAEALCRWRHGGEIINPDSFIPTYEQNLDICKLDFYVLEHVCRDIKRWLDEGREVVRISVNLSRKHMMDIDLVDNIISIIDRFEVPHRCIEIELTETTTDVEFKDLKRVVGGLQSAGISTAVDDFGIGYSSLNLLSEIPWNVIKIDKSLIPAPGDNSRSAKSVMFRHVVTMAKELGLECISEGVETQEQIDLMLENGCDLVQGFFFDKPLPRDKFVSRLDTGGYIR